MAIIIRSRCVPLSNFPTVVSRMPNMLARPNCDQPSSLRAALTCAGVMLNASSKPGPTTPAQEKSAVRLRHGQTSASEREFATSRRASQYKFRCSCSRRQGRFLSRPFPRRLLMPSQRLDPTAMPTFHRVAIAGRADVVVDDAMTANGEIARDQDSACVLAAAVSFWRACRISSCRLCQAKAKRHRLRRATQWRKI